MMENNYSFIVAFLGGVLSFVSPCVLPLVPGYLSYVAGVPISEAEKNDSVLKTRLFTSSLFFVVGFSLVFIALGAGASAIAPLIREYQFILGKIAGGIIFLMGLHILGLLKISFLYKEFRLSPEVSEKWSIVTPFILGVAFGLGWTPCIGPILAGILILAANQETILQGMFLLSSYAMGLAIPFLLASVSLGYFQKRSQWLKKRLKAIEIISGVFLILTGFFIFTGSIQGFGSILLDNLPFLASFG